MKAKEAAIRTRVPRPRLYYVLNLPALSCVNARVGVFAGELRGWVISYLLIYTLQAVARTETGRQVRKV